MIGRYVLEQAVEAIFNHGLEEVTERWDCPHCGCSFAKVSCSKPYCRQDLLLQNEHQGKGWQVAGVVYPEYPIEISCECEGPKRPLRLVPSEEE